MRMLYHQGITLCRSTKKKEEEEIDIKMALKTVTPWQGA